MADSIRNTPRNDSDNQRLTENLQHHSRLLFEASEELKEATQAKTEFVAEMSHEFRGALNVIIGFTELMLDEVPGPVNQQQRSSLEDILDSGHRLLALVNAYLEHSEYDGKKVIKTNRGNE